MSAIDDTAMIDNEDIAQITSGLREHLTIEDRRYGFPARVYRKCFLGTDAVQALIDMQLAPDRAGAVRLGNVFLSAGVFHHVLGEHSFKDQELFYRLAEDEDHGHPVRKSDGTTISWADFLAPLPGQERESLQAEVPPRDIDLAELQQVDLESVGIRPLDEHNVKLLDNTHPKAWVNPAGDEKYNLVVIGAGSGGLVSAAGAAGVGARVALIESHLLGGDCLNLGCVPSKALLRSAHVAHALRNGDEYGVRVHGEVTVDFAHVMERMRALRAGISPHDSAERFSSELGVDVFMGRATFVGPNAVDVDGKRLEFAKAIIATGGSAAIPAIPGLADVPYLTNASIFNLTELPPRLGVIGAGPIGLELAQAFQRFGSEVTVFVRGTEVLPKEDAEAAELVRASMERDGVVFRTGLRFESVDAANETIGVYANGERFEVDALLVATGRKPHVDGLGLDAANVKFDERQGVHVNDRLQTSNPAVFAVGDIATKYQFTHVADFMARIAIKNSLFFGRDSFSKLLIPWATYTDPEVAHVGLYEADLEARGIAYQTFRRDFADVDRAILESRTGGFVKVHVRAGSDEILGATLVGAGAGDLVSELTLAMASGTGLGTLASVIHPYPTFAEAIRQCGDAYNRTRLTSTVKKIFNRLMAIQRR